MSKLIDLNAWKLARVEKQAFSRWCHRFKKPYDGHTRLSDMADNDLMVLAAPGDEGVCAFYELIMGALGLHERESFEALNKKDQMRVIDIHLFLADQARFELMRRLNTVVKMTIRAFKAHS